MARHKLRTDSQIRGLKPGRHGDGDGLWLYVQKSGSRSWVFIYVRHGVRKELGLGSYGTLSGKIGLSEARARADEIREILKRGGDPSIEVAHRKRRGKLRTFGEIADEVLEAKENTFRNAKHKAQWRMTLTAYAAQLRKLPVAEVETDHVISVLRPLWDDRHETASRLRGRIETVLDYARSLGLRNGENPARWHGHLAHILGKRDRIKGHHSAMPYDDVPQFMTRLQAVQGGSARALELCVLTATRSGETLNAKWSEFDFEEALWTIPAERMKARRPHMVPLPAQALRLVTQMKAQQISDWVFPGREPRRPLSNMAMTGVMRRLGFGDLTVHGFRSSFRDWAGDQTTFPREVAELALAHNVGNATEQAYRRASALAKRRKLMEAWANYLSVIQTGDNVSKADSEKT